MECGYIVRWSDGGKRKKEGYEAMFICRSRVGRTEDVNQPTAKRLEGGRWQRSIAEGASK